MPESEFAHAQRARDARMRHSFLRGLHLSRANAEKGWVGGRFLNDMIQRGSSAIGRVDDDHAIGLLRDLVAKDMAEERDDREYRHESFSLDRLSFRITSLGSSFMVGSVPADADIDDGRIVK